MMLQSCAGMVMTMVSKLGEQLLIYALRVRQIVSLIHLLNPRRRGEAGEGTKSPRPLKRLRAANARQPPAGPVRWRYFRVGRNCCQLAFRRPRLALWPPVGRIPVRELIVRQVVEKSSRGMALT